jgi:hypothetical protein
MSKKRKKTEYIWGTIININGAAYGLKPVKFYNHCIDNAYYSKDGNGCVMKLGLDTSNAPYCITFASKNKRDVELFLDGIKAFQTTTLFNIIDPKLCRKFIDEIDGD